MNRKTKLTLGRQEDETFIPSTHPSTQDDIKQLEERFHIQLYKELALENGLCPKRRRIYDDLFNELVRIVNIECSERGQLLQRVKDEHQQWMNTYEELYSSSMAYGMRQYLNRMEENKNTEIKIENLEDECKKLRGELEQESIRFEKLTEKPSNNKQTGDPELRILRSNVKFLQSANEKLKSDLDNVLNEILSSTIFLGEPIDYEKKTVK
ncbi:unnamed protein product [Rotaria magnacalcarata]|uniref:Uncharacterized protein n=1 Tax=Rotaria magnacalcarata TaxID=392030 RepID=A0A815GUC7_9BILA|nr:unnamed protein product [Rotaria magnacalcarata]CAF1395589.1 unnamed protein product [Rotaria magnacalcarata]CAF2074592.1 unnamed protein product [Rotaria magnacalcarata]CAF2104707.1 unnamed protein product [Rotaria magnacalcarata]CAF2158369.1 unnamed protein product [Rotaria magnacalcarata]